jgi:hypothetical protein
MIPFGRDSRNEGTMAGQAPSVKRYVVRLSGEAREQLQALIRRGKGPASRLLKARILLKADISEAGEMVRQQDYRVAMLKGPRTRPMERPYRKFPASGVVGGTLRSYHSDGRQVNLLRFYRGY